MTRTRLPQGIYSIADLARREGISEKSARGRLRKYFGGTLADLGIAEWTYGPEDLEFVLDIIRPKGTPRITRTHRQPLDLPAHIAIQPIASPQFPSSIDPFSWPRMARSEQYLPAVSGVYALFIRESSSISGLVPAQDGLIYIGLGRNLAKRCHFNGKTEGHSPRRSLAALLWRELKLEPELAANGNFKLRQTSERCLDAWMHDNLLIAFETFEDFCAVEDTFIRQFAPPLNLTKCPQSVQHKMVKRLRKAMLEAATSPY